MSTRRRFLAGAAATTVLAAPAIAQGLEQWRMVTAWPRDLTGPGVGAQRLADRIGELTDGKLTVRLYAAGELVPAQENSARIIAGEVELGHDMSSYALAKSPAFAFFSSIPFGLIAQEHESWVRAGGGQALWDELGERLGLRFFLAGNSGARLGGWSMREIATLADLKGLRFRVSGLAGQALERLGVVPLLMPGSQIAAKFRAGELDAAQFMGPVNDTAFGLQNVAKFLYWPGFEEPCAALQLQVNRARYDALPKAHQAAIAAACAEENARSLAEFNARAPAALAAIAAQGATVLKQFPPEVYAAFGKACGEVLTDIVAGGDDLTKRVAASYFGFREQSLLWTRIGDQGFANMRLLEYAYPRGA